MEFVIGALKMAGLAKSVAEYLGIIEGVGSKIDKLSKAELEAAIRTLEQSVNSDNETVSLLRDARNHFNKAVVLEKNFRKVNSLTGLAVSNYYLEDIKNAKRTYEEISETSFDVSALDNFLLAKRAMKYKNVGYFLISEFVNPLAPIDNVIKLRENYIIAQKTLFERQKLKSKEYLERLFKNENDSLKR